MASVMSCANALLTKQLNFHCFFLLSLPAGYSNVSDYTRFPSDLDISLTSANYNSGTSSTKSYGLHSENYNTPSAPAQSYGLSSNTAENNEYEQFPKQNGNLRITNSDFKNGVGTGMNSKGNMISNANFPKNSQHGLAVKDKGKNGRRM
jgi:hypothetical protein